MRPRVTTLLSSHDARISLLVAPAGYGKTTAIQEWLHTANLHSAWYRCDSSSADVAALAVELAAVIEPFVAGAAERVRTHLQGTPDPGSHAREIALTLAGALAEWPRHRVLIIDDYDYVRASPASEQFIESLLEDSTMRVVVAARRHPGWASVRRRIYGGTFELDRSTLALTVEEAREVLRDLDPRAARVIWEQARGWPAVVRLAALTGDPHAPVDVLPPALHEYFAEELYSYAPDDVQHALLRLAALPRLRATAIRLALGANADDLCARAADHGFLSTDSTGAFDLHPLLKTFLESKLRDSNLDFIPPLVESAMGEREWDDAFSMIDRFELLSMLPKLMDSALEALLSDHRVATLDNWLSYARRAFIESPIFDLVEAELAQRAGDVRRGEMHARHAARGLADAQSPRTSRAYALAGQCAHLDCRPDDAVACFRSAQTTASSSSDALSAVWGRFVVAAMWETEEADELLRTFDDLSGPDPAARLRVAAGHLMLSTLRGSLEDPLRDEASLLHLVDRVADPLATTSLLYRMAYIKVASGRYAEGLNLALQADAVAVAAHLGFASIHITAARAGATIGLRQFRKATSLLARLADMIGCGGDPFEEANMRALNARLLLGQGLAADAALALEEWQAAPNPALRAECAALRAVALAITGENDESHELASFAMSTTTEVQGSTLAVIAGAISDISTRGRIFQPTMEALERVLLERRNWDSLVCAYRAHPALLPHIAAGSSALRAQLENVLVAAHDRKLAVASGVTAKAEHPPPQLLSRREREVYDLVCRGLTNRDIAAILVISEPTVKVHVRHIMEKLGAKTRTEAASRLHDVYAT